MNDGDDRGRAAGGPALAMMAQRAVSIVTKKMREEGAHVDETAEYVDSLIASARRRFPAENDEERWVEVRGAMIEGVEARLRSTN